MLKLPEGKEMGGCESSHSPVSAPDTYRVMESYGLEDPRQKRKETYAFFHTFHICLLHWCVRLARAGTMSAFYISQGQV